MLKEKSMLKAHLLREQGYKQWEIAERLGVSECTGIISGHR